MRQLSETLRALLDEASQRKSTRGGARANQSHAYVNAQNSHSEEILVSGQLASAGSLHEGSISEGN
jgi:hypothetical protein